MLVTFEPSLLNTIDWRYFIAGGVAAAFSHGISVPFDVIKTRIQLDPSLRNIGYRTHIQRILQQEGVSAFSKGMGQTLIGYGIHGSLKYGVYHELKPVVSSFLFEAMGIQDQRLLVFILAAAMAELIGTLLLTPFESMRIRAVGQFSRNEDESHEVDVFRGLPALIARQVPYTVTQLTTLDVLSSFIYSNLEERHIYATTLSSELSIAFVVALVAAALSTIVSHPGDTVMAVTNGVSHEDHGLKVEAIVKRIYEEEGVKGFFKGFRARLLHVSVIVVSQFLAYDSIEEFFGIPIANVH